MAKIDGPGLAAVSVGIVFIYGGVKGYSPIKAFENIITGKNPNENQANTSLVNASGSSSNSSGGGATPANASESAFISAMLSDLGAPNTAANINSVSSWFKHEEPSFPPPNAYNPLNIMGGGSFAQYPSAAAGAQATAQLIQSGYPLIAAGLKSGNGICGSGFASDFNRWSGSGYSSVC